MTGDFGPYQNDDGDVWVPRTVPYLEARKVAKTGFYDETTDRLTYLGKADARLLGFTRGCQCEDVCEAVAECDPCMVPAWHFRLDPR